VIGLPGDRIQMKDGLLHINDTPVKRERLSDFIGEDPCGASPISMRGNGFVEPVRTKRWKETLPNGVIYESLDCVDSAGFPDTTNVYEVPQGSFFMMGDNRDNSSDSRVFGYVPFENLVGRAQMIFFSMQEGKNAWVIWRWPWTVRWNRIFSLVR
jgi:signal peptidase I